MKELAEEYGYSIDDLFEASRGIAYEMRSSDGYHYKPEGSSILAGQVAASIRKELNI